MIKGEEAAARLESCWGFFYIFIIIAFATVRSISIEVQLFLFQSVIFVLMMKVQTTVTDIGYINERLLAIYAAVL